MLITGYAGTGKTTILSGLVNALDTFHIKTLLLAPTGRAAKVLMNYSGFQAYTIHKKIFRQKSSKDGFGKFVLNANLYKNTFFIVDEASMISNLPGEMVLFGSGHLLDDLIEFVYNSEQSCKLILIGDKAQLPPVGLDISPALEKSTIEKYNIKTYHAELREVVRQSKDSGILMNATRIRTHISANKESLSFLFIKLSGYCQGIR